MFAPEANALAEMGTEGAPRPGKMVVGAGATGVEAGVGVGCGGWITGGVVVSTFDFGCSSIFSGSF